MNRINHLSAFEYHYIEDELRRKYKLKRKIYFDSYDIISMIQGVWHFSKDYKFEWQEFMGKRNVEIHAIAQRGWLGNIFLLKPHQDEFIYNLTKDENDFPKKIPLTKEDIKNDLLHNLLNELCIDNLKNPYSDNFIRYVKELKTNSILLFKSNSVLSPIFWLNRYKKLVQDDRIIQLDFSYNNYTELTQTDLFSIALIKLEKSRSRAAFSNYMDALSVVLLQEEVNKFKKSNYTLPLPIFYTGTQYLRKVMLDIFHENPQYLSYPHPNKPMKYIPVFRFEDFFIIDPIFNLHETDNSFYKKIEDIKFIKESLTKLIKKEYMRSEASVLENKIRELIGKEVDLEFFNKLWLKGGYNEFIQSIKEYIQYYDEYNESIEKILIKEQTEIKETLKTETEHISLLRLTIKGLKNIRHETDRIKLKHNLQEHPSLDFGLIRFSFSSNVDDIIDNLIESIFENMSIDDEDNAHIFNSAVTKLIDNLIRSVRKYEISDDLIASLAILWIYSKFDLIVIICDSIFQNRKGITHQKIDVININSFYSIYSASITHSSKIDTSKFYEVLESHLSHVGTDDYRFKLTRAFSLFQLWYRLTLKNTIPEDINPVHKKLERKHYKILKEAISLVLSAIIELEKIGFETSNELRKMYFYLINNYVYYTIKGAKIVSIRSKRFIGFLSVLKNAAYDVSVWQNRFYDTLGWNYYRLAYIDFNNLRYKDAIKNIELAKDYNDKSFDGPTPKREYSNYKQLRNEIGFLMDKIMKNDKSVKL